MSKKFGNFIIVLVIALLLPATVFATTAPVTINSMTAYCNGVQLNYSIPGAGTEYVLQVREGTLSTGTLLGSRVHGTVDGTFNMIIPINPPVADGTTYTIWVTSGGSLPYAPLGTVTASCISLLSEDELAELAPPAPPAYWLFGGENARASIFIQAEENGANNPVLALYDVNEESQGSLLFYMSLNASNAYEVPDGQPSLLLYANPDEFIELYLLASGEYQVNLGPDFEGKMHVLRFRWDGGEPYNVIYDTYFIRLFNSYAWADTARIPV